ncbi:MAG: 1-acyl-sn-glycerol-3-phosphate acyltransferase [Bacteroidia bacterium]|nr:1-acyl-sn-glycerol-3-phosphate acyltransferase [Bacteroidia bacterium]
MDILRSMLVWAGGIILILVLFPVSFIIWLIVLPFDKDRRVIHRILIWQSRVSIFLLPVKSVRKEGKAKAVNGKTYVVISNHQSILDILFINTLGYRMKWISKIENKKIPIMGWYLAMADYIPVDRGNEESKLIMMEKCLSCLRNGTSIMIFPEGTRSKDGEIGFFKRGAFQLAIQAGIPILPIVIDGTGGILPKHGLVFGTGHDVRIKVLDPVNPESFGTENPDELALKFSSIIKEELTVLRNK